MSLWSDSAALKWGLKCIVDPARVYESNTFLQWSLLLAYPLTINILKASILFGNFSHFPNLVLII